MTLSPAFYAAERAWLTPPEPVLLDVPDSPVGAGCVALLSDSELDALAEADAAPECEPRSCTFCEKPVCDEHGTGDAEYTDSCEGPAHTACHAQACTDRECWYDPDERRDDY